MAHELTPAEARELLGAYAIDAVDADERRQIERHLLADADARAELHALQLGAAWLEQSSERPSDQTWSSIAGLLDDAQSDDDPAPVASLDARRSAGRAKPARLPRLFAVAAALVVVVVVAAGAVTRLVDDPSVVDTALADAAAAARRTPGATELPLKGDDGKVAARVVVLPGGDGIVSADLPRLPSRRTYELWAETERGAVPVELLGRDARSRPFHAGVAMSGMFVTDEPAGGSPRPTGRVVAHGRLSSA